MIILIAILLLLAIIEAGYLVHQARSIRILKTAQKSEEKVEEETTVPENSPTEANNIFLNQLTNIINEEMAHGRVEIESLADKMCISRSQLNRRVNALTGMSTSNYAMQLRLEKACRLLLEEPSMPIGEIAMHCGFEDAAYFTRIFRQRMGQSPSAFRRKEPFITDETDKNQSNSYGEA